MKKIYSIYDLTLNEVANKSKMYLASIFDTAPENIKFLKIDLGSEEEVHLDDFDLELPTYIYSVKCQVGEKFLKAKLYFEGKSGEISLSDMIVYEEIYPLKDFFGDVADQVIYYPEEKCVIAEGLYISDVPEEEVHTKKFQKVFDMAWESYSSHRSRMSFSYNGIEEQIAEAYNS